MGNHYFDLPNNVRLMVFKVTPAFEYVFARSEAAQADPKPRNYLPIILKTKAQREVRPVKSQVSWISLQHLDLNQSLL